jgi:hypothetical protein
MRKPTKKTRTTRTTRAMRTTRPSRTLSRSESPPSQATGATETAQDEILAVLVDDKRGREYYVSMIDSFQISGRLYAVMYNFEPDIGSHPEPELVIMRTYRDVNGDQVFVSIRNRAELDEAFDEFFRRYQQSL